MYRCQYFRYSHILFSDFYLSLLRLSRRKDGQSIQDQCIYHDECRSQTSLAFHVGDKGSLTLYGRIPGAHQLFAERGRTVDEWKLKPQSHDNHFLDCVAGCAVCGSMLGASLPETLPAKLDRKPMIRLSDKRLGGIPQNGRLKLSELRRQKNG